MTLREPCLPPGWYPRDKEKISEFLDSFNSAESRSAAAMAPHAGWYYSGNTAAMAVSSLKRDAETVAVIGGHLPGGMPVLMAAEEGVKTPFGPMTIDRDLREELKKRLETRPDRYQDNTVEVLLPMVHYFFPGSELLWLRFPAHISSFEAGKVLAEAGRELGRRIVVLASTDLTHYGRNYGFNPRGSGRAALDWVKKVNDAAFIAAVLDGNPSRALACAEEDSSACSAGAVLGALGFTAGQKTSPVLLDYRTSADAGRETGADSDIQDDEIPDSFVGYAAVTFVPSA